MHILIIEDNPDIAANLGDFLEERGHTVDFAGDAEFRTFSASFGA